METELALEFNNWIDNAITKYRLDKYYTHNQSGIVPKSFDELVKSSMLMKLPIEEELNDTYALPISFISRNQLIIQEAFS